MKHSMKVFSLGLVAILAVFIVIGAEFPLHEVAEAHRLIEQRQHTGKILLTV